MEREAKRVTSELFSTDFISSAFQCDQIGELLEFSSNNPCQQLRVQKDTLQAMSSLCNAAEKPDYRPRPWRKLSVGLDDIDCNSGDYKTKKIMHREAERQRRQEMAALYSSLRSLLPVEYVKGKKSMSDHMVVAVDYIRRLQKRIEEKGQRREELKSSLEQRIDINAKSQSFPSCLKESVTVESSRTGFQITVSTPKSGGLSLSKVLDALLQEGLNVVSCISTNSEERSRHIIDSEVGDGTNINPSELRMKLKDLMV